MLHYETKKITARISADLLHKARAITGKGTTETLKIALTQLVRANVYNDLRKMRGKVKFSNDLVQLRKDD